MRGRFRSSSDEKAYEVQPGEALRVDKAATQAALVEAGHDSFLRRVRQLVDPSPPVLAVDPVLVRGPAQKVSPSGFPVGSQSPAAPRS